MKQKTIWLMLGVAAVGGLMFALSKRKDPTLKELVATKDDASVIALLTSEGYDVTQATQMVARIRQELLSVVK